MEILNTAMHLCGTLAIEMKRRNPDMMMINDPSHICGNRHMLQDVAQKAIDLDFDGLMIESHIDPDKAWSDAKQQVTPERLAGIAWMELNGDTKLPMKKNLLLLLKNCENKSTILMMN